MSKGRNIKIKLSTPRSAEEKRKQDAVESRRAGLERWFASEQQPEQHALKLDLPGGAYRCRVCGTVGEPLRRSGDAFFASKRCCGGMRGPLELCHADLGAHGELVRQDS